MRGTLRAFLSYNLVSEAVAVSPRGEGFTPCIYCEFVLAAGGRRITETGGIPSF